MIIDRFVLHVIENKLKKPFTTSFGTVELRQSIIVEAIDDKGVSGWGECVAFSSPWYTEETTRTCLHIMEDFLIPIVFRKQISHPSELKARFREVRRNPMAKAAVEMSVWDLAAKNAEVSLADFIGATRKQIPAGAVVGINTPEKMKSEIEHFLNDGYQRIKIKIYPESDERVISEIRNHFPDLPLMADANSAYTLDHVEQLKNLDKYNLLMIEQPLGQGDFAGHALLQKHLQTPVCLDESIASFEDARQALALDSCRIINVKIGRVGGLQEALDIHQLCLDKEVPLWVGGMLETGVSRAFNIALAALPGFTVPGDISASSRYWHKDITLPEVKVSDGWIDVPADSGIGYIIDERHLKTLRLERKVLRAGV
ncbi:o-succinylbenzoate synthase [Bacillus marinisedimentorum]|uniref:o-succinylbenzoate synthase n=1 Tax=Bacillus marinisedimentorum TaxID=1821260 RepID=UPI000871D651|nr:o-succinylbenzoate synthase [Bacillus marinisedimentorum]